ncbi:MAG TPA: 4-hydroxy-tetrahydrodipicolinate synthase [Candidatus Baltobacteraceae bacterium]|nr:4-hydroxy-tetrahydrodipicolinate synthase [Candidatus Baltobacteraceae bacterium]
MLFTGCGTALVTPFRRDLSLDEEALRRLARRQVEAGINFLVPCGTTGESPTLSKAELRRVVEITIEEARRGKIRVVAGAGGYNTAEVIERAQAYEAMGADGILSVAPYYNKPTQEGLYQHYKVIAGAISLPIILYNIPGRTGVNIEPATIRRLAEIDNIVGVKEASGNISQMAVVLDIVPDDFVVLSGDDGITIPLMSLGGRGLISVSSNEIPAEMTRITQLCLAGDFVAAREIHRKYFRLMEANFIETNPGPVKAVLGLMGLLDPVFRLPLVAPKPENLEKIRAALEAAGLVQKVYAAR